MNETKSQPPNTRPSSVPGVYVAIPPTMEEIRAKMEADRKRRKEGR